MLLIHRCKMRWIRGSEACSTLRFYYFLSLVKKKFIRERLKQKRKEKEQIKETQIKAGKKLVFDLGRMRLQSTFGHTAAFCASPVAGAVWGEMYCCLYFCFESNYTMSCVMVVISSYGSHTHGSLVLFCTFIFIFWENEKGQMLSWIAD